MSNPKSNNTGCVGLFLKFLGLAPAARLSVAAPYRLRDDFLSPAETSFYHVLVGAAAGRFTVCPKVNLNDLFFVAHPDKNQAARNRISRKHVDFLLCEPGSMRPLLGIELDDATHARADRQSRDALVQQVFAAAGLPLRRIPARHTYNLAEVEALLTGSPDPSAPSSVTEAAATEEEAASEEPASLSPAPECPKCQVALVVRRGSRGQFYGCPNFPRCRETALIP